MQSAGAKTSASWSVVATTFVPFAAGYFISYWVRTINGPLAGGFAQTFNLGPADLGLMTSIYFLAFATFQIPAGLLIDRYGPRRVQATLFPAAAFGCFLFASARSEWMLLVSRALIGLGCSAALVSGVTALAQSLPPKSRAIGNCGLVMCGGLGSMASAAPIGEMTDPDAWRNVFAMLGIAILAITCLLWTVSAQADRTSSSSPAVSTKLGYGEIVRDTRFWRVAPLSAAVVGSAFAIHGLWAARLLADLADLSPEQIASVLLAMGAALTIGAVGFGLLATWLRRQGISTTTFFGWSCAAFMVVELTLAVGGPIPPAVTLSGFGVFGAITVLSFTILGETFPATSVGRANGALNVLHLGSAFLIQAGIGAVVSLWQASPSGHIQPAAYTAAILGLLALQACALAWFTVGASVLSAGRGSRVMHRPGRSTTPKAAA